MDSDGWVGVDCGFVSMVVLVVVGFEVRGEGGVGLGHLLGWEGEDDGAGGFVFLASAATAG